MYIYLINIAFISYHIIINFIPNQRLFYLLILYRYEISYLSIQHFIFYRVHSGYISIFFKSKKSTKNQSLYVIRVIINIERGEISYLMGKTDWIGKKTTRVMRYWKTLEEPIYAEYSFLSCLIGAEYFKTYLSQLNLKYENMIFDEGAGNKITNIPANLL